MNSEITLIDSHCHLNFPELSANLEFYLNEMAVNNIDYALCISTHPDNIKDVVAIADKYSHIFASVGIHPDEKLDGYDISENFLLEHIKSSNKVIAVGETGLDYYHTTRDEARYQIERFITHINVAKKTGLPLIIHTRNSIDDVLAILREQDCSGVGVVMHCFTENIDNAKKALDLGCYISISGVVTFKNAKSVQEMAEFVPLERMLIETDAPFLAPSPFRGKLNHPALVRYTAEFVADLKETTLERVAFATTENFYKLFKVGK